MKNASVVCIVLGINALLLFTTLSIEPPAPCSIEVREVINPGAINSWTSAAPMPGSGRSGMSAGTVGNNIYIAGGADSSSLVDRTEAYSPSNNTWWNCTKMPSARVGAGSATFSDRIYSIGGEAPNITNTVVYYNTTTNSWSNVASMLTSRSYLYATSLNGLIYAVGGRDASGNGCNAVEAYCQFNNTWWSIKPMTHTRINPSVIGFNNNLYVIGGLTNSSGTLLSSVEVYCPSNNTWWNLNPIPSPRRSAGIAEINGVIYTIGGRISEKSSNKDTNTGYAYSPANNTWWAIAPMKYPRGMFAIGVLRGCIYSIGGYDLGVYRVNNEEYSPIQYGLGTWAIMAPMPGGVRSGLRTATVGNCIYAIGGTNDGTTILRRVEAYCPGNNTWWNCANMTTPRSVHDTISVNGLIYAIGGVSVGSSPPTLTNSIEVYNPVNNTWSDASPMLTARAAHATVVCNNIIYAIGGGDAASNGINTVEAYNPLNNTWWKVKPLRVQRRGVSVAVIGETIFAMGGQEVSGGEILSSVEAYSNKNNTWWNVKPLPVAKTDASSVSYNGILYYIGGRSSNSTPADTNTAYAYCPANNTWWAVSPMNYARSYLGTAVVGFKIYAIGGYIGGTFKNYNEEYNPIRYNQWVNAQPACVISSPVNGSSIKNTIIVTGTASDPDGNSSIMGVEVKIDSGSWLAATGTVSWQFKWSFSTISEGHYTIYARSIDNKSVYSDVVSAIVNVSNSLGNTPPTCEIISPVANQTVHGDIIILGIADDPDGYLGILSVQVKIDSNGNWLVVNGESAWTYSWNTTYVGNGIHTIYARAIDNKSVMSAESSVIVIVQNFGSINNAPVCQIINPLNGDTVNGNVNITGTAADIDGNSTIQAVEIQFDNGIWQPMVSTTFWNYQWDSTQVENGAHTINARAFDGINYSVNFLCSVQVWNNASNHFGWIAGTVVMAGTSEPLPGAFIKVEGDARTGVSDSQGNYNITLPEGIYNVSMQAIGYHSYTKDCVNVIIFKTTVLDFALTAYTGCVQGKVSDADMGNTIAGAKISIDGAAFTENTDTNGYYRISNITTGTYNFTAVFNGYYDAKRNSIVVKNATVYVNFSMTARNVLTGVVSDRTTGKTLEGVLINIDNNFTTSLPNGTYSIRAPTGWYNITAVKLRYNNYSSRVFIGKGITRINITLNPHINRTDEFNWFWLMCIIVSISIVVALITVFTYAARRKILITGMAARNHNVWVPPFMAPLPLPLAHVKVDPSIKIDIIEQRIVDLLREHPCSDPQWIATALDIRIDNLRAYIKDLVNSGYLRIVQSLDKENVVSYEAGTKPRQ